MDYCSVQNWASWLQYRSSPPLICYGSLARTCGSPLHNLNYPNQTKNTFAPIKQFTQKGTGILPVTVVDGVFKGGAWTGVTIRGALPVRVVRAGVG